MTTLICMKKPRYLLKRTKFAVIFSPLPIIFGILLLILASSLVAFSLWADSFQVDEDLLPMAKNLPVFYDVNGNKMDYISDNYISPDDIPTNLKNAFVALEDKRFYSHSGYDPYRIVGAVVRNIKSGGAVEGASTITQQLVKNTHLTFEKTITRKLKEIALATKIEEKYSKDEIFSMYLSVIYFGGGAYGIKSASKLYFDKAVEDLTLSECATLAGIIKSPTKYSPTNQPENSKERRNLVLDVMHKQGYIDDAQLEKSKSEPLVTSTPKKSSTSKFFIDMVINQVCETLNITKYQLDNSGLTIHTTFDPNIQRILTENSNLTSNFSNSNVDNSSVVLDNDTGYVLAYHSSLDYEVFRQLGSTIKPIVVYAPALEAGLVSLATPINDEQISFGGWSPKNYGDKYFGIITPREAIKKSSNTVAVKIASYIGESKLVEYGRNFNLTLTDKDKNLTTALGATEKGQSPLRLASAYSTFANEGQIVTPTFIRTIIDKDRKIWAHQTNSKTIISSETAYLIADCLYDTVEDGTARSLSSLPFKVAAKTGTVSDDKNGQNYDAWCVSFNKKYTLAVWHGDSNETGGGHPTRHASNLWKDLYQAAEKTDFYREIERPDSIISLPVDTYSTKENMQVTLATSLTPSRYISNEIFTASNSVNFGKSLFDNCEIDFDISIKNGLNPTVIISFDTKEIYQYSLTRKDVFGEKIIYSSTGKTDVQLSDNPISFGLPITYTLDIFVSNGNERKLVGTYTKTIMF